LKIKQIERGKIGIPENFEIVDINLTPEGEKMIPFLHFGNELNVSQFDRLIKQPILYLYGGLILSESDTVSDIDEKKSSFPINIRLIGFDKNQYSKLENKFIYEAIKSFDFPISDQFIINMQVACG
jgi:hypothetical protein